jgi:signal transduction histidine kinase
MRSIQRHVLAWAMCALLLGSVTMSFVAYRISLDEINEVLDANLMQVAMSIARLPPAAMPAVASAHPPTRAVDSALEMAIQTWSPAGRVLYSSHAGTRLPFVANGGLSRIRANGIDWDVYTLVLDDRVVQVGQRAQAQQSEATEAASRMLWPSLGLVALMGGLLWLSLRRGLRPLGEAASTVAARSPARLDPMPDAGVPRELRPLVWAINTLMQRLSAAMDSQRRFVAEAAHALRTPITAVRLQLGLLEAAPDEAARQQAMAELRSGVDRTQHLLEQLLQLSRNEPGVAALRLAPVSLQALAREAVTRFSARADALGIDLGARAEEPLWVLGDETQLALLLDNLVDNALRYCPAGSQVDVVAARLHGQPALQVIDSGPGIAAADRDRVLDRFYRGSARADDDRSGAGSGLGLAIVKAIADAHDADLVLSEPVNRPGLAVSLGFRREAVAPATTGTA